MRLLTHFCLVLFLLGLAGCGINPFARATATPAATPTAMPVLTVTPGATSVAAIGTATPTRPSTVTLTIWLPPEFDVQSGTGAGKLLLERLTAFTQSHPGVTIDVRIKADTGPSSLIDSLSAASAAAPNALPDLIALSRADIETGAVKGLLAQYDGLTTITQDADWYSFARQLMVVQGHTFALPFAGDALLILYRPGVLGNALSDWPSVLNLHSPLVFSVGDPQALFPIALYLSTGGKLEDDRGRPLLQADALARVFDFIARGAKGGSFPYWISDVSQVKTAWQVYQEQRTQMVVAWTSTYLTELPADTTALPLPALQGAPVTLAAGWGWVMPELKKDNRAMAVALAEYLMDSSYLGRWTEAAGYLPTRPSALTQWQNKGLQASIEPVIQEAQAIPENDLLAGVSTIVADYTRQVIQGQAEPQAAAEAAAKSVGNP